jgi:hypothetical protein
VEVVDQGLRWLAIKDHVFDGGGAGKDAVEGGEELGVGEKTHTLGLVERVRETVLA